MRLLLAVDSFAAPPTHGSAIIAQHWGRCLRQRGHDVDLLVVRQAWDPAWDDYVERHDIGVADLPVRRRPLPLRAWAPLVGLPPSLLHVDDRALAQRVAGKGYDAVLLVGLYLVGLAERLRGVTRVVYVPTDSPSLVLGRRRGRWGAPWERAWWRLECALWRRIEARRFRGLPAVVFVSARDAAHATRDWPPSERDRVHVVPLGVDAGHFAPGGAEPVPTELVFTGVLGSYDSAGGAAWFMDRVLPRVAESVPDVRFRMAGRSPPAGLLERARRDARIEVNGDVADLRPYLDRAGVYVLPLLTGGGAKTRLLEALAMARPVVSTSEFPRVMGIEDGTHLLVADAPDRFADAVVSLIRDRALAERLGRAGRELVLDRFTWEAGAARVEELLNGG